MRSAPNSNELPLFYNLQFTIETQKVPGADSSQDNVLQIKNCPLEQYSAAEVAITLIFTQKVPGADSNQNNVLQIK